MPEDYQKPVYYIKDFYKLFILSKTFTVIYEIPGTFKDNKRSSDL